ncbi:MAG: radical SAM protein [Polyangiaceae bacterium]
MTDAGRRNLLPLFDPRGEASHETKGLLRLTMACNERCPFCNVPVEDYAQPTPPRESILTEVDAFIAAGEQALTISGGEPTLYRDRLLEATRRAREGGILFVEVQTNAVLIDDAYAAAMRDAGVTSAFVSLLSDEPELHDRLAGLDGAFARCLGGIDALLAAGIHVTLNPVIAFATQLRVARYIDFVAARLPGVRTISLSAVQPHGRAAKDDSLLPDYALLGPEVRRARQRAQHHGILLLNPYCGLPLCVGWDDDSSTSVEAIEAELRRRAEGHAPRGVQNQGDKSQAKPCLDCALRPRCGGAWNEYWRDRQGSGLRAPLQRHEPWTRERFGGPGQTVVHAPKGVDDDVLAQLSRQDTPTKWLLLHRLRHDELQRARRSGATDVALWASVADLSQDQETPTVLRTLAREQARLDAQHRLRVVLGLTEMTSFRAAFELIRGYADLVEAVRLLGRRDAAARRFAEAASQELGLPVTVVELSTASQS